MLRRTFLKLIAFLGFSPSRPATPAAQWTFPPIAGKVPFFHVYDTDTGEWCNVPPADSTDIVSYVCRSSKKE